MTLDGKCRVILVSFIKGNGLLTSIETTMAMGRALTFTSVVIYPYNLLVLQPVCGFHH